MSANDKIMEIVELRKQDEELEAKIKYHEGFIQSLIDEIRKINHLLNIITLINQYNKIYFADLYLECDESTHLLRQDIETKQSSLDYHKKEKKKLEDRRWHISIKIIELQNSITERYLMNRMIMR